MESSTASNSPLIHDPRVRERLRRASNSTKAVARYDWRLFARPDQRPPEWEWSYWLLSAGRGFGKTRTGAEFVRGLVTTGRAGRIAMVAPTSADCRDTMVEGVSGILACSPPWDRPLYEPSKRRLTWGNGAQAFLFSAEEPDRLRGPAFDAAWVDELAAWKRLQYCWDMLQFAVREGVNPQICITTTPRPLGLLRELIADPNCHVTTGSTLANRSNLPQKYVAKILRRYEGTRLGQQELDGKILESVEGAIVSHEMIAEGRRTPEEMAPEPAREDGADPVSKYSRVVVGVDPATTSAESSDKTGIVAAGKGAADGDLYALKDRSCRMGPDGWARRAIDLYRELGADLIVAEKNQGGEMVEHTLRTVDPNVPVRLVHASRGKHVRAEPILALYEQGRVHHVGVFEELESQVTAFTPAGYEGEGSPDEADAFIWAATELMIDGAVEWGVY